MERKEHKYVDVLYFIIERKYYLEYINIQNIQKTAIKRKTVIHENMIRIIKSCHWIQDQYTGQDQ